MARKGSEPRSEADLGTDIQIPSTPPPQSPSGEVSTTLPHGKAALTSPPPPSTSMTPPPSTQPARLQQSTPRLQAMPSDLALSSPPATIRVKVSGNLPSADTIASATIDQLRSIATDLVQAVSEARMSAAHFKLQHSLLTIETEESAQRAEIEHQMTRREVEVLHAVEHKHRLELAGASRLSQTPSQIRVDALTTTCRELEADRDETERRLWKAKKLIEIEKDRSELLLEENLLLKNRIRENREHFSKIKSGSPIYATPRDAFTTPQRRNAPRFTDSTPHDNFAALLAADQVLNGESVSVPVTPTKPQPSRFKPGHIRGAHSLSSLHTTPARARPTTSDGFVDHRLTFSAPSTQLYNESAERERHDRDSTISVSDGEDDVSDRDFLQSQASSLATSMLRKNPGSQESLRLSQSAAQSSNLLQTKIFGNVKKPGVDRASRKRQVSNRNEEIMAKKAKVAEGVGLGIGAWSPR